ncbi:hypothetical protein GCM10010222_76050 [Streptomyces tanashiensis]|nr:hypothetical protein GCM10010222_76050 [Streptomyces tanashiensis]
MARARWFGPPDVVEELPVRDEARGAQDQGGEHRLPPDRTEGDREVAAQGPDGSEQVDAQGTARFDGARAPVRRLHTHVLAPTSPVRAVPAPLPGTFVPALQQHFIGLAALRVRVGAVGSAAAVGAAAGPRRRERETP